MMKRLVSILFLLFSTNLFSQQLITLTIGKPIANYFPDYRVGQSTYIIASGTSITYGTPYDNTHSYVKYTADSLGSGYTSYYSAGIPSSTTAAELADYPTHVIPKNASIALVEGGVNDIATGVSKDTTIANLKSMITANVNNGSLVVLIPILPWSNGTATQMYKRDSINNAMKAWMAATYPTHFVCDLSTVVGQDRPGYFAGNYWDQIPAYNADGVHYVDTGYQVMGHYLASFIKSHTTPRPVQLFITQLIAGTKSGEILNFSTGVNEFDIITPDQDIDGLFHFFYDKRASGGSGATYHRQASTIAGLQTATETLIKADLRYPSAIYGPGGYHLFGRNFNTTGKVEHYTSESISGLASATYNDADYSGIDCNVRAGVAGWIRAEKTNSTGKIFSLVSASLNGPWLNRAGNSSPLDFFIPTNQFTEESDPDMFGYGGRYYVTFTVFDGTNQKLYIGEVNPNTGEMIGLPTLFASPDQAWEGAKIFNPVFFQVGSSRYVGYSANKGSESSPLPAGWGYISF